MERWAESKFPPHLSPLPPEKGGEGGVRGKLTSPPFGKWFSMLTILSLSKEGGRERFSKR